MIATATFVPERMQAAADERDHRPPPTSPSTSCARGTPFREAHAIVGALVRRTLAGRASLRDLVAADPSLGPDAAALVGPGRRPCGCAPLRVAPGPAPRRRQRERRRRTGR